MNVLVTALLSLLQAKPVPDGSWTTGQQVPKHIGENTYLLTIETCDAVPTKNRRAVGFRMKGQPGIVAALHSVAGCRPQGITARQMLRNGAKYHGLSITEVDIEHDLAVLGSSREDLQWERDRGLQVATASRFTPLLKEGAQFVLKTWGFPSGWQSLVDSEVRLRAVRVTDWNDAPPKIADAIADRGSPSVTAQMFCLQGPLAPGHSGAPLLTLENHIVGVVNGGLADSSEIGLAAPIWQCKFSPAADHEERLKSLGKKSPTKLFLYEQGEANVAEQTGRLFKAIHADDETTVEELLSQGVPAFCFDDQLGTPVVVAAAHNSPRSLEVLLGSKPELERYIKCPSWLSSDEYMSLHLSAGAHDFDRGAGFVIPQWWLAVLVAHRKAQHGNDKWQLTESEWHLLDYAFENPALQDATARLGQRLDAFKLALAFGHGGQVLTTANRHGVLTEERLELAWLTALYPHLSIELVEAVVAEKDSIEQLSIRVALGQTENAGTKNPAPQLSRSDTVFAIVGNPRFDLLKTDIAGQTRIMHRAVAENSLLVRKIIRNIKSRHGRRQTVEHLEIRDDHDANATHALARGGSVDALRELLERYQVYGGSQDLLASRDSSGRTPLHHSMFSGSSEMVEYILGLTRPSDSDLGECLSLIQSRSQWKPNPWAGNDRGAVRVEQVLRLR